MVRWTQDLRGEREPCHWLAASTAAGRVYCGDFYGVVEERDRETGAPTGVTLDPQLGSVGPLAVSSDGRGLVAFGDETAAVSLWRIDGNGPVTRIVAAGQAVMDDGYSHDDRSLLVARRDRSSTISDDFVDFAVWDPVSDRGSTRSTGWVKAPAGSAVTASA